MRQVLDLINNFKKDEQSIDFINSQFDEPHTNKNVLFVSPQLNGRNFYKYIMPYILLYEYDIMGTAIIGLDKFKQNNEYDFTKIPLYSKQILWADFIVFPFSIQNLSPLYENIRYINPEVKIVYNVDFNYYLLGKTHPLYEQFNNEESKSILEDNIFFADLCVTTNQELSKFLAKKFEEELNETKYRGIESNVEIATLPLLIDEDLIMENFEKVKPNIDSDSDAIPDEEEIYEEEIDEVEVLDEVEEIEKEIDVKNIENTDSIDTTNEGTESTAEEVKAIQPINVGIIASNYTWEDLNSYREQFKEVNDKLGENIIFYVIGYDGIDLKTNKNCFPSDFKFEYIKPCTIIHYFKQIHSLNLDLLFIPLRKNDFNETSENYNKMLEASLFNVPVMVADVFPYNKLLVDGENGIILKNKKDVVSKLNFFLENPTELKRMGENANKFVKENFSYSEYTIGIFDEILS